MRDDLRADLWDPAEAHVSHVNPAVEELIESVLQFGYFVEIRRIVDRFQVQSPQWEVFCICGGLLVDAVLELGRGASCGDVVEHAALFSEEALGAAVGGGLGGEEEGGPQAKQDHN